MCLVRCPAGSQAPSTWCHLLLLLLLLLLLMLRLLLLHGCSQH
jgi:hypothetical protein